MLSRACGDCVPPLILFGGLKSFSNIVGITSSAWASVDHTRLCVLGNGVVRFRRGWSEGGHRLVYHFDVADSEGSS